MGQNATNTLGAIDTILADYKNIRAQTDDVLSKLLAVRSKTQQAASVNALNATANEYEQVIPLIPINAQINLEKRGEVATIVNYNAQIQNGKALCGL